MTYENYSPEWLAAHCDHGSAFERAVSRQMTKLLAENAELRGNLKRATSAMSDAEAQRDKLLDALHYAVKQVPELITVPGIRAAIDKTGGAT